MPFGISVNRNVGALQDKVVKECCSQSAPCISCTYGYVTRRIEDQSKHDVEKLDGNGIIDGWEMGGWDLSLLLWNGCCRIGMT